MKRSTEATRWLSRPAGGDAPEDRLAALVRAGAPTEGLGAAARDRVWTKLDAGAPASSRHERRALPLIGLRWSVAAAVLLTSSAVVGGMTAHRWWPALKALGADRAVPTQPAPLPKARARAEHPPIASALAPALAPETTATVTQMVEVSALVPVAAPDLAPAAAPMPHPRARRAANDAFAGPRPEDEAAPAEPAPSAVEAPSALANETALLGAALARLRQQRDAQGALAALDAYDARVPHGTLRREADAARVDALIMLGRDGDAFALLQTLALQPRGRDLELRVVRGELGAAASCPRAVADFDEVLASAAPPALAERALHGRATCLARLGDTAGAQRDLREYLRRYPGGRFASEARRLVEGNDL